MIIEYDKSFEDSLEKTRNKYLFQKIGKIIVEFDKLIFIIVAHRKDIYKSFP